MDPKPPAPLPSTFVVYFSDPAAWARFGTRPQPHWRLAGKGELTLEGETVRLRGRRPRPFWVAARVEIPLRSSDVINVVREGRLIQCHVRIANERDTLLRMWAVDAASAEQICNLLPKERTPEFERVVAEEDSFKAALRTINARAVVTPALVLLNCAAFVFTVFQGADFFAPDGGRLVALGSNYGPFTLDGQWWRLLTSMFLHFGILHLLLNMWALWSMGQVAERLYGSVYFLVLYLFAGLCGSIGSLLWHPSVNSAGASGAIFGVLGGLLAFMLNPKTRVPPSVAAPQRNSALVFVAYNLLNGFAHTGIDNAAHIGGLIGGLAIGWCLARPLDVEARENPAPRLGVVTLGALALLLVLSWRLIYPKPTVAAERHFRHQFILYADDEDKAVTQQHSLYELQKSNKITEAEWGRRMATEVLPLWKSAEDRISAATLPPESRLYPLRTELISYLDEKRHALSLLSDAARYHDSEKALLGEQVVAKNETTGARVKKLVQELY